MIISEGFDIEHGMTRLLPALLLLSGCYHSVDAGPEVSDTRSLNSFSKLRVQDGLTVHFAPGAVNEVEIATQQKVLENLLTEVKDGTLTVRLKPGVRQELKDAQENMAVYLRLAAEQRRLLLVDLRDSGPTGPGVRELYAQHTAQTLASALLVGSPLSQMIGNFFLSINRPSAPCRMFTAEAPAVLWLRTFAPRTAASP